MMGVIDYDGGKISIFMVNQIKLFGHLQGIGLLWDLDVTLVVHACWCVMLVNEIVVGLLGLWFITWLGVGNDEGQGRGAGE